MDIEIKDIITLNDYNEYIVVGKTNYQDNAYYFLIDKNDNENMKFCLKNSERNSLQEIYDMKIVQILLPLFIKSSECIAKNDLEILTREHPHNDYE